MVKLLAAKKANAALLELKGEVGATRYVRHTSEELSWRHNGRAHHLHAHLGIDGVHHEDLVPRLVRRTVVHIHSWNT